MQNVSYRFLEMFPSYDVVSAYGHIFYCNFSVIYVNSNCLRQITNKDSYLLSFAFRDFSC